MYGSMENVWDDKKDKIKFYINKIIRILITFFIFVGLKQKQLKNTSSMLFMSHSLKSEYSSHFGVIDWLLLLKININKILFSILMPLSIISAV